jgi:cysteinyl-tRNA synthetase
MLSFYNTLSGRQEEFTPLETGKVRMYICGPTVYGYAHIGNFRAFVFGDILRRHLLRCGFDLAHVMNYTDVDDKTIRNAGAAGLSLTEYTNQYIAAFEEDSRQLRLQRPDQVVRATEHIDDMARAIKTLGEKGFTYRMNDSIYFRISEFPGYGKLSRLDIAGIRSGARLDHDEYEKDDVRDFVLWKAPKQGEPFWETEIGPGRPGWHIECSVMSTKYLGETFDIHAGGTDLIFPHHENEIAQSEALSGKPFARYWLHCEHLLVDGQKMSKSVGNMYTLRDLMEKGFSPLAIRYQLASVPYRRQLNFTMEGLHQASAAIQRLENFRFRLVQTTFPEGVNETVAEKASAFPDRLTATLDDDLNTAQALGVIFELVRDVNSEIDSGLLRSGNVAAILQCMEDWNTIFDVLPSAGDAAGVGAAEDSLAFLPQLIEQKIAEREQARQQRDFARADRIRQELAKAGILIEDAKDGVRWRVKKQVPLAPRGTSSDPA